LGKALTPSNQQCLEMKVRYVDFANYEPSAKPGSEHNKVEEVLGFTDRVLERHSACPGTQAISHALGRNWASSTQQRILLVKTLAMESYINPSWWQHGSGFSPCLKAKVFALTHQSRKLS
jgi:hypothetical protein